jgi:hypothetical protein
MLHVRDVAEDEFGPHLMNAISVENQVPLEGLKTAPANSCGLEPENGWSPNIAGCMHWIPVVPCGHGGGAYSRMTKFGLPVAYEVNPVTVTVFAPAFSEGHAQIFEQPTFELNPGIWYQVFICVSVTVAGVEESSFVIQAMPMLPWLLFEVYAHGRFPPLPAME